MKFQEKLVSNKKAKKIIMTTLLVILCLIGISLFIKYDFAENGGLYLESWKNGSIKTESGIYYGNPLKLVENNHEGEFVFDCGGLL